MELWTIYALKATKVKFKSYFGGLLNVLVFHQDRVLCFLPSLA